MRSGILIFSSNKNINIYIDNDLIVLERENYYGVIESKSSLVQLLPLFELSVNEIIESLKSKDYKIEAILPLNKLLLFLILEMKSSYWVRLFFSFLLDDRIKAKLSPDALSCLQNENLSVWLPQKERHLVRKLISKSLRVIQELGN
jgi:hypothetical protein